MPEPEVRVTGPMLDRFDQILTPEVLQLLGQLESQFGARRRELLAAREVRQAAIIAGADLDFLPETKAIRDGDWKVAPASPGLIDRRVEITGPAEQRMTVNALNSGAKVWLADFEDAIAPFWENLVNGQLYLRDALDRTLDFTTPEGRAYALKPDNELATIVVRPRGWHLEEKHLLVDGKPMSASLFDFTLYFFHCAQRQIAKGKGPYFYLPKMESHLEARLWNDVFNAAQDALAIPRGTIRATVLIETYPVAFEMEEILYELRDHSAGLNAGRWDFIFSMIKKLRTRGADYVLPDRAAVAMTVPFMRAYTELLVSTCHKRGAHAIGGMSAFIPNRRDAAVNDAAMERVHADKKREAGDGFDGSWVAHPDLVDICYEEFNAILGDRPNQLDKLREDVRVTAADIRNIAATPGAVTEAGVRNDASVGVQYLQAWLGGTGAVAIFNLMEDAATAEISRSQIWQWIHNGVQLEDGTTVTADLVQRYLDEEIAKLGEPAQYAEARRLFEQVALNDDHFEEFLTIPAYQTIP